MKPTLFITGISGLLGLNAALQCRSRFHVAGCYHSHPVGIEGVEAFRLDVADAAAVASALRQRRPDVVLHTAGLANVDACETRPALAARLNVEAAQHVARAARAAGARLIHISTDHLFSGEESMVSETEAPQPLNEYARTKLEAERVVAGHCPDALIVRTNFFGWGTPARQSFSDWILQSLAGGETLNMFTDVFYTPILINDLVEAALALLDKGATGIFNVAGSERLSKYEFGVQAARLYAYSDDRIRPARAENFPFKARRPLDMSLSVAKAEAALGRPLPSVAESLRGLRRLQSQGWPEQLAMSLRADIATPISS